VETNRFAICVFGKQNDVQRSAAKSGFIGLHDLIANGSNFKAAAVYVLHKYIFGGL
jgi:hypothetical protein